MRIGLSRSQYDQCPACGVLVLKSCFTRHQRSKVCEIRQNAAEVQRLGYERAGPAGRALKAAGVPVWEGHAGNGHGKYRPGVLTWAPRWAIAVWHHCYPHNRKWSLQQVLADDEMQLALETVGQLNGYAETKALLLRFLDVRWRDGRVAHPPWQPKPKTPNVLNDSEAPFAGWREER